VKKLLTGNEAVARGVYEAGIRFASAYPGTPSTEILENILQYKDCVLAEWAINEKVALEAAFGASLAGGRAIVSMKHVGVNVAADPLFTISYIGINGGLVLVSADETGQYSSQNEQDNRNYAKAAKIPMLEPADSQEAKDMVKWAVELSEEYDTPVMLRMTTRVCHSKSIVELGERETVEIKEYNKDVTKRMTVPAFSRRMRVKVEERMELLKLYSDTTPLNRFEWNDTSVGIIASGMAYNYAKEVFGDKVSYLKIGFSNPLPRKKITEFANKVDKLYVIEENDPYIEETVRVLGFECYGKNLFPYNGEMTPDVILEAINGEKPDVVQDTQELVVPRPAALCAGCPHRGVFYELGKLKNVIISGDIGCYTLGFAPPFNAMDYNICMGASISSGHGVQQLLNMDQKNNRRVISILGDSTFFHTGINSLLNVVYNQSNTVNIIMDNRTTGMTGHQENPGTGYTANGNETVAIDIEALVKACGITHVAVIDPNDLDSVRKTLAWALALDEPSVIITRWPCALKRFSKMDTEEFGKVFKEKYSVNTEKCIGCKICVKVGCPALSFNNQSKKAEIDLQCVGCSVCAQVCPKKAISVVKE
jgi:indolepyruvate ferredoxin oxidoreductase alpha subunit